MALYKYSTNLTQNPHEAFDAVLTPGTVVTPACQLSCSREYSSLVKYGNYILNSRQLS
jgi:hypothetical protein